MMPADRFLRTGTVVPEIYHGTAAYFRRAARDTQRASERLAGEHYLEAVYRGQRLVLQVYEDGECTYVYRDDSV
jgi:hypothetical protein